MMYQEERTKDDNHLDNLIQNLSKDFFICNVFCIYITVKFFFRCYFCFVKSFPTIHAFIRINSFSYHQEQLIYPSQNLKCLKTSLLSLYRNFSWFFLHFKHLSITNLSLILYIQNKIYVLCTSYCEIL